MLSKNQIKLITRLHSKKFRKSEKQFIAEGLKLIRELIDEGLQLNQLYTVDETFGLPETDYTTITPKDLKRISALKNPSQALAVFTIPEHELNSNTGLTVVLDNVQDPGNLGTIIRLCDWFGVSQLICSTDTVDCYNPKVVQATMGSLARVPVTYCNIKTFLEDNTQDCYGTFMDGDPIYDCELNPAGILILGNEGHGISDALLPFINQRISIPNFSRGGKTESLNVASALAVCLSEFRRTY